MAPVMGAGVDDRCWGRNDFGQTDPPDELYAAVSMGVNNSCAVRDDRTIICWGSQPIVAVPADVQTRS